MVLALKDQWVWDSWYAHDGERWHAYFLKAPRSIGDPDQRHYNVSHGHAVSRDLVTWDYLGTCFEPAEGPAWDDKTTWTGSVVRDADGLWHLFYTGASAAEDALYQRIGHATSHDMHNWERVGSGLCLDLTGPNADRYESELATGHWHDRAMRDPWVLKDPEGDGWLMYFTARAPGIAEPNAGGAIGFATSPDLYNWTLQPPVFVGGFGQLEVPQVFKVEGRWYCLFCTGAQHWSQERRAVAGMPARSGSHYLMAQGPRGPWQVAPGFYDGSDPCRRYAARILSTGKGLAIIGFEHEGPRGFVGQLMDPELVEIDGDGFLHVSPEQRAAE
jgi:beta-fructofuranosidase